jgi:hypothetical protein
LGGTFMGSGSFMVAISRRSARFNCAIVSVLSSLAGQESVNGNGRSGRLKIAGRATQLVFYSSFMVVDHKRRIKDEPIVNDTWSPPRLPSCSTPLPSPVVAVRAVVPVAVKARPGADRVAARL